MRKRNPNSFDLYGDGDDVDVIRDAEKVFGISISDEEAERIRTFGDFLDCVEGKLNLTRTRVCLLRRAFLDLRVLAPASEGKRMRPSLPLAALGEGAEAVLRMVNPWARRRAEEPWRARLELAGMWGFLAIPFLIGAWMAGGVAGVGILAIIVAGLWLSVPTRTIREPVTVGALLRANFHHLYPDLARRHGPGLASDRWSALEALCREVAGHDGPVNRDTTFFSHHFPEGAR